MVWYKFLDHVHDFEWPRSIVLFMSKYRVLFSPLYFHRVQSDQAETQKEEF